MKRKITALLLSTTMCLTLCACGEKTEGKLDVDEKETEKLTYTYYSECEVLPDFESVTGVSYSTKSTTSSTINGVSTRQTVYKYSAKNDDKIEQLIQEYIKAIEENGLSTKGSVDTEISIISDEMIIATIKEDDAIELTIIPDNMRVSSKVEKINVGDVIITDDYEFTLKNVEFAYEVLPKNTSGYYSYYPADSGKVYIHVEADVKNTMQRDIKISELFTAKAVYDGEYMYSGFVVVDDDARFLQGDLYAAAAPLETCGAHALIECPEEVVTSGKSVVITLCIGNVNYEYTIV